MAIVPTSTGTYISDLFNPEVVGQMIDEKLTSNIVFAPLAFVDDTLQGHAGDTVTLPYFDYIGDAAVVEEGHDIPISKLTQQTKKVTISKIGKGVQLTDEAVLSGYGDPIGEGVRQIVTSIASKVDDMLLGALNSNTRHVYAPSISFGADDIPKALALFGEDSAGSKVLVCDADLYADLLGVKSWIPASEIAADIAVTGVCGMAYGCQVMVSDRVAGGNFHIVKPGALGLFLKRDVLVETDRDIVNQSTVMTGSKLFAPYLYKPVDAIKIVNGIDGALAKITVVSAAGTASGDTAITVSGYTPGTGESYKYLVAESLPTVYLGQDLTSWTSWNGSSDITAATGKIIVIAAVDSSNNAVAAGSATVTAKT